MGGRATTISSGELVGRFPVHDAADTIEPSHVLAAMGVLTHGNVRVSLHRGTTADDVDRFLEVLPRVVAHLRRDAGVEHL